MKKIKKTTVLICSLYLLISCGGNPSNGHAKQKKETPKALQEDNYEKVASRYSGDPDLVEELYSELADNSPTLKQLEKDLDACYSKPSAFEEEFNTYDNKSSRYYSSGESKHTAIRDSVLRKRIVSLIADSRNRYLKKT